VVENITVTPDGTIEHAKITLKAAPGEEHDGTAGSGVSIEGWIFFDGTAFPVPCSVENLEFFGSTTFSSIRFDQSSTADLKTVQGCLLHDNVISAFYANGHGGVISFSDNLTVQNTIIYDMVNSGSSNRNVSGIAVQTGRLTNIDNCTIYRIRQNGTGNAYGISYIDDVDHTVRNNLVIDTGLGGSTSGTVADYNIASPSNATAATNLSSDSSAPGAAVGDPTTAAANFIATIDGSENLYQIEGADATDVATDLGTANGVNIDHAGTDRDEGSLDPWDCGAQEFIPGAPPTGGVSNIIGGGIVA
jgi:hypothetical protein